MVGSALVAASLARRLLRLLCYPPLGALLLVVYAGSGNLVSFDLVFQATSTPSGLVVVQVVLVLARVGTGKCFAITRVSPCMFSGGLFKPGFPLGFSGKCSCS